MTFDCLFIRAKMSLFGHFFGVFFRYPELAGKMRVHTIFWVSGSRGWFSAGVSLDFQEKAPSKKCPEMTPPSLHSGCRFCNAESTSALSSFFFFSPPAVLIKGYKSLRKFERTPVQTGSSFRRISERDSGVTECDTRL